MTKPLLLLALLCMTGAVQKRVVSSIAPSNAPGMLTISVEVPMEPIPGWYPNPTNSFEWLHVPVPIWVWRYVTNSACGGNTNQMPDGAELNLCEDGCVVWTKLVWRDGEGPDFVPPTISAVSTTQDLLPPIPPSRGSNYTGWFAVECEHCNHAFSSKSKTDVVCGAWADGRREHVVTVICPSCKATNSFHFVWQHKLPKFRPLVAQEVPREQPKKRVIHAPKQINVPTHTRCNSVPKDAPAMSNSVPSHTHQWTNTLASTGSPFQCAICGAERMGDWK